MSPANCFVVRVHSNIGCSIESNIFSPGTIVSECACKSVEEISLGYTCI